jgi:hypothetical protein
MTEQSICKNCLHVNAATDAHMMRKGKKSSEKMMTVRDDQAGGMAVKRKVFRVSFTLS